MPHERIRNSPRGSCDPSTELPLRVGLEQDDPAVRLDGSEAEDLRHEWADLARREVRDCDDGPTDEIGRPVPRLNRDGGLPHPMGAEIDSQTVRWITRLREIFGGDDPTDAHLDFLKILEGDCGHGIRPRGKASVDLTLCGHSDRAGASVGAGIGHADTESSTQPLVFLPTRPLDPEIVSDLPVRHPQLAGDLDREFVGLYFGRPVHITVAAIPEFLAFVPLTNMDQFVKDVKIQRPLLATLKVV